MWNSLFQNPDSLLLCIISQKQCSTSCGVGVCSISRVSSLSQELCVCWRATPALSAGIFCSNRRRRCCRPDRRHSPSLSSVPGQWPLSSSVTCTDPTSVKNSSTRTFPNTQITTKTWRSISSLLKKPVLMKAGENNPSIVSYYRNKSC